MTDARDFEALSCRRAADPTLSDLNWIKGMIVAGNLLHIEGDFVSALGRLSDEGRAEFCGCEVIRTAAGDYRVIKGSREVVIDGAVQALIEAQASLDTLRHPQWRAA